MSGLSPKRGIPSFKQHVDRNPLGMLISISPDIVLYNHALLFISSIMSIIPLLYVICHHQSISHHFAVIHKVERHVFIQFSYYHFYTVFSVTLIFPYGHYKCLPHSVTKHTMSTPHNTSFLFRIHIYILTHFQIYLRAHLYIVPHSDSCYILFFTLAMHLHISLPLPPILLTYFHPKYLILFLSYYIPHHHFLFSSLIIISGSIWVYVY